jgi:hypothetical protein
MMWTPGGRWFFFSLQKMAGAVVLVRARALFPCSLFSFHFFSAGAAVSFAALSLFSGDPFSLLVI